MVGGATQVVGILPGASANGARVMTSKIVVALGVAAVGVVPDDGAIERAAPLRTSIICTTDDTVSAVAGITVDTAICKLNGAEVPTGAAGDARTGSACRVKTSWMVVAPPPSALAATDVAKTG